MIRNCFYLSWTRFLFSQYLVIITGKKNKHVREKGLLITPWQIAVSKSRVKPVVPFRNNFLLVVAWDSAVRVGDTKLNTHHITIRYSPIYFSRFISFFSRSLSADSIRTDFPRKLLDSIYEWAVQNHRYEMSLFQLYCFFLANVSLKEYPWPWTKKLDHVS